MGKWSEKGERQQNYRQNHRTAGKLGDREPTASWAAVGTSWVLRRDHVCILAPLHLAGGSRKGLAVPALGQTVMNPKDAVSAPDMLSLGLWALLGMSRSPPPPSKHPSCLVPSQG